MASSSESPDDGESFSSAEEKDKTLTSSPDNDNNNMEFRDHYSLGRATELRFRGKKDQKVYVLDNVGIGQQLVMVAKESAMKGESNDPQCTSMEPGIHSKGSFGASLLRVISAGVSLFILTVWAAFSVQCIFFLFMNVVGCCTPSEWTSDPPIANLVGCIFACPVLVDSLAKILAMSTACMVDCWRGISTHHASLWRSTGKLSSEWFTLIVFFVVPTLTFAVANYLNREIDAQNDATIVPDDNVRGWYELTILSWAGSVFIFQLIYMEFCFIIEISICYKLLKHFRNTTSVLHSIKTSLILTQRQKYSGIRKECYMVENLDGDEYNDPSHLCGNRTRYSQDSGRQPVKWKYSLGTRLSKVLCCFNDNIKVNLATDNENTTNESLRVKRNYTIDEIFGNVRIVTRENWSLQNLWCINPKRVTSITILSGKAAVTRGQFISGNLCIAFGMVLVILAISAFLIWFGNSWISIVVIALFIIVFCFCPMLVSLYKIGEYQRSKSRNVVGNGDEEIDQAGNDVVVSVWENVRVTEPKEWVCFASAAIEIMTFFLWPLISLFYFQNTNVGIVFLVLGIHMIPRHYFNASAFLQDSGPIDDLDMSDLDLSNFSCAPRRSDEENTSEKKSCDTKNKALIANFIGRITRSPAKRCWLVFMIFCFFASFCAYIYATGTEAFAESDGFSMGRFKWKALVLAEDFSWDAQPNLEYPTCDVGKGFAIQGGDPVSMSDFSFLGILTFASPIESQPLLNQWFGNGTITDDFEYVAKYRESVSLGDHPVEFKLYTLANDNTTAVVAIRGSEARWDWLVDGQLWLGSILAQIIKNFNPLGYLWDPILDEVVFLINFVQSKKLKEVSYYRFTSGFVETLYNGFDGRTYKNLRITGVSLGGGLSILTGAITETPAIAFSGLNAMFSRRTFLPPITEHQLNTMVFNTIPQRDWIAHTDKPGLLHQNIQCTAPKQNFVMGCHSMQRTLCEIQYKCGSRGRPILCLCVSLYGYPVPTQIGNVTWEEACSAESTAPGAK